MLLQALPTIGQERCVLTGFLTPKLFAVPSRKKSLGPQPYISLGAPCEK